MVKWIFFSQEDKSSLEYQSL